MLMKLWNEKYSFALISSLTNTAELGLVLVHILAPLGFIYILYGFIGEIGLIVWFCMHLILFVLRIFINVQLIKFVKKKSFKVNIYLKLMYMLSFLGTVLFAYMIWKSVLLNVPDTSLMLLGIMVAGMAMGSLSTLGSVFTAYIVYMVPSFLFLISAFMYHGGDVFILFSISMFTMMSLFIRSGYRHYIAIRDVVSLDTTFKTIYENSSDGVVIFQENKFLHTNKAMQKLFKYESQDEFLKISLRRISPMYQPDGNSSAKKMLNIVKATFTEGHKSFEWVHKDKNGQEFWCEIVLTKINLNGNDLIYGVWRDISDRKKSESTTLEDKKQIELLNETLEQRVGEALKDNKMKDKQILHQSRLAQMGEMISMIAHQWRQPLSAIASAGALINLKSQLGSLDKKTAMEVSQNIANYTQHLSTTIDDFRDFFKQDKEKEVTNFTYLVNSVFSIIRSTLETNNIKIIEELNSKDSFMTYSNELKQVIINLVKNAQDALLEKKVKNPYIKLKSYSYNRKYILEVSDSGGGIPENVIDEIFNPYFSTKLKKDGTGLGLYMSKMIVEEHCGGSLSCYNTKDGACFKIELPHAQ